MNLYNTASKKIEEFKPLNPPNVGFYTCGPTVYDFTHIGHLRTYVNNDVLKRTLDYLGYKVRHVMNITDVGHLTSDGDEGEDKMEKGAVKKGTTVWELAKVYTEYFINSIDALNIKRPDVFSGATAHIPEFISLIKTLERKGFTYQTDEAIYFNVLKFKNYGSLSGQKLSDKKTAARDDVHADPQKNHPADFVLWFKRVGKFKDHAMHWESPWGDGFPGWHIECSAMCIKYLGDTVDIHAGGIDHIPVHHENEIAQSEAATNKKFVKYWFHNEFLLVDGRKMSKSLENFYTVDDIKKRGIDQMALRLLFLQTHYRQIMNFTWDSLLSAETALKKIKNNITELKEKSGAILKMEEYTDVAKKMKKKFISALEDDLQTPQALSIFWEVLKSDIYHTEKLALILEFDEILGLNLENAKQEKIDTPQEILKLAEERELARKSKNFQKSDELRELISENGYNIEDTSKGYKISKK